MNGNCHLVYGTAVGTAIAINLDKISENFGLVTNTPETATLFVLGGILGGIFPDIDNPSSYVGKLTVPISSFIGMISGFFGKKGWNHRGIFHDPSIYLIGLILSLVYFPPLAGFFIGCLSHIFLDMFNPMGVPFILGQKRLHLGRICSGSKESIVFTWINTFLVIGIGVGVKFFV